MAFSSTVFLFFFLPLTLLGCYIFGEKRSNIFLLVMSIFFYAWGEPKFVIIMIISVMVNYLIAIVGEKRLNKIGTAKLAIVVAVVFNCAFFVCFKYLNFIIENLNFLLPYKLSKVNILMPVGISFFTFQSMSYIFDVCSGKIKAEHNFLKVLFYVCFFPKMLQGPIVRYETISNGIRERHINLLEFYEGVKRFVFGLAKKMLIANTVAVSVDYVFTLRRGNGLTTGLAWLGALGYFIQIYFDFSGYSDMAIGLCLMLGIHIPENFNFPYCAQTVSDFWRRWHITLGTWFRDYVYFPLGGSRVKKQGRLVFNLFVVWLLTGIWHGANWTFIVWGLMYFVIIAFEKIFHIEKRLCNFASRIFYRVFTLLCIIFGWVVFRSKSISQAIDFIKAMCGVSQDGVVNSMTKWMWSQYLVIFIISLIFCINWKSIITSYSFNNSKLFDILKCAWNYSHIILIPLFFFLSLSHIVGAEYNPFIYFNF